MSKFREKANGDMGFTAQVEYALNTMFKEDPKKTRGWKKLLN
jgi:hypothetical protein